MNYSGIIVGISTFLLIGIFHVLVVKAEYYFTKSIWWLFLLLGFIACCISLFIQNNTITDILGVLGFCLFWSIKELFEQEKRRKNKEAQNEKKCN